MEYGTETAILIDLHEANGLSVKSQNKSNLIADQIKYKRTVKNTGEDILTCYTAAILTE
jgi:hypothetical protein